MKYDPIGQGGKLSQCFTPDAVADIVAAALPGDGPVFDACCGSGSLVGAVVRRWLREGREPAWIVPQISACDVDPVQVAGCIERLVELLGEGHREELARRVVVADFRGASPASPVP